MPEASSERIEVIATTISGSIRDWGKVKRIVPLFAAHGFSGVTLHAAESHAAARETACAVLAAGARTIISAGGSGTFNAILEGCCDSLVPLPEIRLGFLRKGSADLIGKTLGMPDEIEAAIAVFAAALRADRTEPCDVLLAEDGAGVSSSRHFVGYGGAEIFGRIPHYTENRFMKWYKGVLGQLFGDLGPFTVGMTLATAEKVLGMPFRRRRRWRIEVDGEPVAEDRFHALIVVNGYLGPDLAFSGDALGSGRFHLFALRDRGLLRLPGQALRARDGSIARDPERWGMAPFAVTRSLVLAPDGDTPFPVNADGSTLLCRGEARFRRVDAIRLLAGAREGGARQ
ncbi:MAG: diacylglycerol kinase family protein [Planctomycetota bacterium]